MKRPTKIKIGGKVYKVEYVDKIEGPADPNGQIFWREDKIQINKHLSETETELTILHEIIHGINCNITEMEVEFMAQALYAVINDNQLQFAAVNRKDKNV